MKRIIPLIMILFLLPVIAHAAWTYYGNRAIYASLEVNTLYTDPYPVEPGNNVVLSIELLNNGSEMITDMEIELKPDPPFILLESSKKTVSRIDPRDAAIVEYDLFVDSSGISALYEIPVDISYKGGDFSSSIRGNLEVRVQGNPKFEIINMTTPERIRPGDQAKLLVNLKNIGTGKAKRTSVEFSSTSGYVDAVFSGGMDYIGDVNPGSQEEVKFVLVIDSDADYGVYTSYINVTYEDESGDEYSRNFYVGILVNGEPNLQIIKTEVDQKEEELSVEIANIGSAKALGMRSELLVNGKVFDVDYVTSIKIDKHSTLKFNLPSRWNTKGELKLSYRGPDNEEYTQTETIVWSVPFTFPSWIIVLAVVVGGYYVWKKKLWKKIF